MKCHLALALLGLCVAASSPALAQDVHTDYDKSASFTSYHTYSWKKLRTSNPLWQSTVQAAVDKSLAEKGWRKVPSGGDVEISALGTTQNHQDYQSMDDGLATTRPVGYEESPALASVQMFKVGVFVVDIYDAQNKHLVWQGTSVDNLSSNSDNNELRIEKAVNKMFRKFPPTTKKS